MTVEFLESEGLLHEFLAWLDAVAKAENDDYYEQATCNACGSDLDSHGGCSNQECHNHGFYETDPEGFHPL